MASQTDLDKGFISALIAAFSTRPEPPTRQDITAKAALLAPLFEYNGDLRNAVEEAMVAIDTRMGAGVSLVNREADHDEEWIRKRDITWTYSEAYENYLRGEKWQPALVRSLSDIGSKILGHLQDPVSDGPWSRRGLVIGHVQSGKTANYMGLVAKSADAGYKFIIVSAGIHNNLRRQTQERIDEALIGRSSDPESRTLIGVGLNGNYPHPATLTTINKDFNQNTAAESGWAINDFSKPIIIVIKKNVRTLDSLHKWLKELNSNPLRGGRISDVPLLFIDDEADNASINTNKEDINPTRTNAMIRRILGLFEKSCYVGYTATPFANIFIDPDSYDDEVRDELFPRDFIYSLDAPTTYFGPEKVFLDEESSQIILNHPITDAESYLPLTHKKYHEIEELPPSLYRAIDQFVVVRAIRNLRGHAGRHCSMMINVSRFVATQQNVRNFVSLRAKKIGDAVKANYRMPEEASSKNRYMAALRETFDSDFSDCGFSWAKVKDALFGVFENFRIVVVNSKSDEVLDFKKYERDGVGLTAIAIGGLSLSRGLTIEGLTISYMYRNTRMYDTLMQMGRWFGYRPGYEDLCRVHLSPDSVDWYCHIANASEELRQQIRRMRQDGLSPKQFGLYVQSHPDSLLITAANKMRAGEKIVMNPNFTGRLVESTLLPLDRNVNHQNEELIKKFWKDGFGGQIRKTKKGWFVPDVSLDTIEEFLRGFQVHPHFVTQRSAVLRYLEKIRDRFPRGDVLLISPGEPDEEFQLAAQQRTAEVKNTENGERKTAEITKTSWRLSRDRLASRGDEALGLSEAQIEKAREYAANDPNRKTRTPSDYHYRAVRNKPLLMIHVLEPIKNKEVQGRFPGFGVSFPDGLFDTKIEVVANRVWLEQMYGSLIDDPDEEDDYDE